MHILRMAWEARSTVLSYWIPLQLKRSMRPVRNVHQQYWWPLELGYTDPVSGLKEYQEKMEAAGIEKVREVLQQQLDAYVAGLKQ